MSDRPQPTSPAALALLSEISKAGQVKTKCRPEAAELVARGLIHIKKGTATLTRAGRWATREEVKADG